MVNAVVFLIFIGICFGQDYKQFLQKIENNVKNADIRNVERELKKKIGIRTQEGNIENLKNESTKESFLKLMEKFSSQPVSEYTCYEVREVKLSNLWRCSYDKRLFSSEKECKANCFKQYSCIQSPCYTVVYCESLKGGYVCPLEKTKCDAKFTCPRGSYNKTTGKCEIQATSSPISLSTSYGAWIFKVEINDKKIRTSYGTYVSWSNWVDIEGRGSTKNGNTSRHYKIWIETDNGKIRLAGLCTSSGWVSFESDFNLSAKDGCDIPYKVSFQRRGNNFRICIESSCSDWASMSKNCPSGYVFNSRTGKCEANPDVKYTCPIGNYACVEESIGVAYCSPYSCTGNINGVPYCMNGNITSSITENTIGLWWCSGDKTWLRTENECIKNCPYYTCEKDGILYRGKTTCELSCREAFQCEEIQ